MNIDDYRREYTYSGLTRDSLLSNPIDQFEYWFKQVCEVNVLDDPNAMSLATIANDGKPSIRIVLLKSFDHKGFVFYTNYTSQKAQEIEENSNVALLFPWMALDRQIEIIGKAEKLSVSENADYIASRPKGSQLGAWASKQSQPIDNRGVLDDRLKALELQYKEGDIPIPDFWGGYRIVPDIIEFWQGGKNRIHDRFEYQKTDTSWTISRLSP